jgi:gliding motility-associated-like protein
VICLDAPVPVTVCAAGNENVPDATYQWFVNGVFTIETADSCFVISGDPLTEGINAVSVMMSLNGCVSPPATAIEIQADAFPSVQADAGIADFACPDQIIQLSASDPSPASGMWSSSDPMVVFENESSPQTTVFGLPSGEYSFVWTLSFASCTAYSTDSVSVTVITPPETVTDTFDIPFGQTSEFIVTLNDLTSGQPYTIETVMNPVRGNMLHIGNGIYRYTPNIGFVGTDAFVYRLCATDCPEECSETTVILRVGDESDCFIPTLFTPNGDGVNDVLIVPCLETTQFQDNKIIIFNEWGDAVYESSPYQNDWDGSSGGNPLPVGTYFYIMDFGDGNTPKRSFLILER